MPKMMEAGKGSIVNIASVVGLKGTAYMAGYAAAKAGLINLTKSAAIESAPNVRVNCVVPEPHNLLSHWAQIQSQQIL